MICTMTFKRGITIFLICMTHLFISAIHCEAEDSKGPTGKVYKMGGKTYPVVESTDEYDVIKIDGRYRKMKKPEGTNASTEMFMRYADKDKAEKHFQKRIKEDPNGHEPYTGHAQLSMMRGEWGEANKLYEQALEKSPENAQIMQGLATIAIRQGKLDKALGWCEEALKTRQHDARLWKMYGDVAYAEGKDSHAKKAYRMALLLGIFEPMKEKMWMKVVRDGRENPKLLKSMIRGASGTAIIDGYFAYVTYNITFK
jgi:tetratricopeptide (TPR) repeat protein